MVKVLPEISEIKAYRKGLGLTQKELSEKSSVSQSLIAKMENGKITPSYGKAKKIFEALEQASKSESLKACDIMSRRVKSVKPGDSARKAISLMERHGLSQVPVLKAGQCVGVVSERGALRALRELARKEFGAARVSDIMEEPLPVVSDQALFPLLSGILSHSPALLVSRRGKSVGIITKSDLLKSALVGRRAGAYKKD